MTARTTPGRGHSTPAGSRSTPSTRTARSTPSARSTSPAGKSGLLARLSPAHAPTSRLPFALLVLGLIVGGLVLLLALNTASAANELRRHGLSAKDADVAAQVQDLRNEVAASAAPGNLAAAAAQLGMVPAGNPAFLVVGSDGTVRVMGKPKAAAAVPVTVPTKKKKHAPKSAKSTAHSTTAHATAHSTAGTHAASRTSTSRSTPTPTPTPTPKPTPTPTPVVTFPGGAR